MEAPAADTAGGGAAELKERGNAAFGGGDVDTAIACWTRALHSACGDPLRTALLSNLAQGYLRSEANTLFPLKHVHNALYHAEAALLADPSHAKSKARRKTCLSLLGVECGEEGRRPAAEWGRVRASAKQGGEGSGCQPSPRFEHTMTAMPHNEVLVLGGRSHESRPGLTLQGGLRPFALVEMWAGSVSSPSNSADAGNTKEKEGVAAVTWRRVRWNRALYAPHLGKPYGTAPEEVVHAAMDEPPPHLHNHSAAELGGSLFVFGGEVELPVDSLQTLSEVMARLALTTLYLDTLYRWTPEKKNRSKKNAAAAGEEEEEEEEGKWTRLGGGEMNKELHGRLGPWPRARCAHACVVAQGCLFVHGGVSDDGKTVLDDCWRFDPGDGQVGSGRWTELGGGASPSSSPSSSERPEARCHHSAAYDGWKHLYLVGGCSHALDDPALWSKATLSAPFGGLVKWFGDAWRLELTSKNKSKSKKKPKWTRVIAAAAPTDGANHGRVQAPVLMLDVPLLPSTLDGASASASAASAAASAAAAAPAIGGKVARGLCLFGGYRPDCVYSTCHFLPLLVGSPAEDGRAGDGESGCGGGWMSPVGELRWHVLATSQQTRSNSSTAVEAAAAPFGRGGHAACVVLQPAAAAAAAGASPRLQQQMLLLGGVQGKPMKCAADGLFRMVPLPCPEENFFSATASPPPLPTPTTPLTSTATARARAGAPATVSVAPLPPPPPVLGARRRSGDGAEGQEEGAFFKSHLANQGACQAAFTQGGCGASRFLPQLRRTCAVLDEGRDTDSLGTLVAVLMALGEERFEEKLVAMAHQALSARVALGQALRACRRYREAEWHLWRALCFAVEVKKRATAAAARGVKDGGSGPGGMGRGKGQGKGMGKGGASLGLSTLANTTASLGQALAMCYQPSKGMTTARRVVNDQRMEAALKEASAPFAHIQPKPPTLKDWWSPTKLRDMETLDGYEGFKALAKMATEGHQMTSLAAAQKPKGGAVWDLATANWQPLECGSCKKHEPRPRSFKRCSRCQAAAYCSPACQKAHWKAHKPTCAPSTVGAGGAGEESAADADARTAAEDAEWVERDARGSGSGGGGGGGALTAKEQGAAFYRQLWVDLSHVHEAGACETMRALAARVGSAAGGYDDEANRQRQAGFRDEHARTAELAWRFGMAPQDLAVALGFSKTSAAIKKALGPVS